MSYPLAQAHEMTLQELVDRVIDRGIVLTGDITISVADVDLVYLGLRVMLTSIGRAEQLGLWGVQQQTTWAQV